MKDCPQINSQVETTTASIESEINEIVESDDTDIRFNDSFNINEFPLDNLFEVIVF